MFFFECPYIHFSRQDAAQNQDMAIAYITGGTIYPNIRGTVMFKDAANGTNVYVNVYGLPEYIPAQNGKSPIGPFGFHIHGGDSCEKGTNAAPFPKTGEHYNPMNQPHGNHAGDFPVLFSNNGLSRMSFFTNKFKVRDIIGKTIVIHENPDDYRTQPSGNSGRKIACGVINYYR